MSKMNCPEAILISLKNNYTLQIGNTIFVFTYSSVNYCIVSLNNCKIAKASPWLPNYEKQYNSILIKSTCINTKTPVKLKTYNANEK